MDFLKTRKTGTVWRFEWHFLFACLILLSAGFAIIAWLSGVAAFWAIGRILAAASLLYAVFAALLLVHETVGSLKATAERLDNANEMLSRHSTLLVQLLQGIRLSDTAKEIVFRDVEQMELGEAALNKLHQHEFDEAEAMIEAISQQPKYKDLGARLKRMAEKYRSATEEGRVNQIIAHIDNLFSQNRWSQAAVQIENLISTFPYSEKAKTMPARLREAKNRHKRELLAAWDMAVRNKDTDHSLEILKELDSYLTPTEALALKESAATVFRTKLHNLGVEFSVAITEKNWQKAYDLAREIVHNFPNSRMAIEIRGKMDILHDRAQGPAKENEPPQQPD